MLENVMTSCLTMTHIVEIKMQYVRNQIWTNDYAAKYVFLTVTCLDVRVSLDVCFQINLLKRESVWAHPPISLCHLVWKSILVSCNLTASVMWKLETSGVHKLTHVMSSSVTCDVNHVVLDFHLDVSFKDLSPNLFKFFVKKSIIPNLLFKADFFFSYISTCLEGIFKKIQQQHFFPDSSVCGTLRIIHRPHCQQFFMRAISLFKSSYNENCWLWGLWIIRVTETVDVAPNVLLLLNVIF